MSSMGDDHWTPGFNPRGTDGPVLATTVYNGRLILAGQFHHAGSVAASYIAQWDGVCWSALGDSLNGHVYALAVYDGKLIVGGAFTQAGGASVNYIAQWDGDTWSDIAGGFDGPVWALTIYTGALVAGGHFFAQGATAVNCIARWDGQSWHALGSGMKVAIALPTVYSLTIWNTQLIAGGDFTSAGGTPAHWIAQWNGTRWDSLGAGFDGSPSPMGRTGVLSLLDYGGALVAGGTFAKAGRQYVWSIATWNGAAWAALGAGMDWFVYALAEYHGSLVASGDFSHAGAIAVGYIAQWTGQSWSALGAGLQGLGGTIYYTHGINTLAIYNDSLIAGGDFVQSAATAVNNMASWHGVDWHPMGSGEGVDAGVFALIQYDGGFVACGGFQHAGCASVSYIAHWDGAGWRNLGSGLSYVGYSLAEYEGRLIVGGGFGYAGGVRVNSIAAWDGRAWSALGTGMNGPVYALVVYNGHLFAGGNFTMAGGVAANSIAEWDGTAWHDVGGGTNYTVQALTVYDSSLVVGGAFTQAGSIVAKAIARWDGSTWNAFGPGLTGNDDPGVDSLVGALAVYRGDLIAGGNFLWADTLAVHHIARWDGTKWNALGMGVGGDLPISGVMALAGYHGFLIAGGLFTEAGGKPAHYIAAWDGVGWTTLGSGVDSIANALTVEGDDLFVGGVFHHAGLQASYGVAQWRDTLSTSARLPPLPGSGAGVRLTFHPATPNPSYHRMVFRYATVSPGWVRLVIYDIAGRLVRTVTDRSLPAGAHEATWDGRDESGQEIGAGLYVARLETPDGEREERIVHLR
jgi:hypothetical protein